MYDLGLTIKQLRKKQGWTQTMLAEKLHVSCCMISKYELGYIIPPFETLRNIAAVFGVTLDTICGMKHNGVLSTHGLTTLQTDSVKALLDLYRHKNAGHRELSAEQAKVLEQIIVEINK